MGMFVYGHLWQMSAISWLLDLLGVGGVIPDWHRESMCLGSLPLEIVLKNSLNIINQLNTGGALILNILYSAYLSLVKTQTGHILRSCTPPGVGLQMCLVQSVPFTTKVVSSNPDHGEVYSIQQYVIKFVGYLQLVGGFLRVLQFPSPIKLTPHDITEIL